MSKSTHKPASLLAGAILLGGMSLSASAFAMTDLASGYLLGAADATKPAATEGKCGEGKCGMAQMDSDKDGSLSKAEFAAAHDGDGSKFAAHDGNKDGTISADEMKAHMEGKCGEGTCGADTKAAAEGGCGAHMKAGAEGSCGGDTKTADAKPGDKAAMEGKCGEGKCGSTP